VSAGLDTIGTRRFDIRLVATLVDARRPILVLVLVAATLAAPRPASFLETATAMQRHSSPALAGVSKHT
jgi:hypothetical protein